MINDDIKKEVLSEVLREFTEKVRDAADEAIGDAEVRILPYVLEDTDANAMFQAEDIVRSLMGGNFEHDGEYITVRHPRCNTRIPMKFSDFNYDHLRDKLIERMVTCPKDAKIEMLERQLREAYTNRW